MDYRALVFSLLLYRTGWAVELYGPPVHQAKLGSHAKIPCMEMAENPPADSWFFAVYWIFQDRQIIAYDLYLRTSEPRYSMNTTEALNGKVHLTIANISVSDGGDYLCSVIYNLQRSEKTVTLDVQASPQVTITNNAVKSKEKVLHSSISGFYPMDIDIKWLRDGEILSSDKVEEPQRQRDGTYCVNSSVTITPSKEDRERTFSCRVQHASLKEPIMQNIRLMYEDAESQVYKTRSMIAISPMTVFSGITVFILFYIVKKNTRTAPSLPDSSSVGMLDEVVGTSRDPGTEMEVTSQQQLWTSTCTL